jgi:hypothetical protein
MSVAIGLGSGVVYALGAAPGTIGGGTYGDLLWINVVGTIASFAAFVGAGWVWPGRRADSASPDRRDEARGVT